MTTSTEPHVHTMDCHTNLICWMLAWDRLVRLADAEADRMGLVSTPRLEHAEARFRESSRKHRAVCQGQDWLRCPVRAAGGSYHWALIAV